MVWPWCGSASIRLACHITSHHITWPCLPQVRLFSRSCEEKTDSFPDVQAQVAAAAAGARRAALGLGGTRSSGCALAGACPNAAFLASSPAHLPPPARPAGGATTAILDAEVVAIGRATGRLRSFQELSSRGRTRDSAHDSSRAGAWV